MGAQRVAIGRPGLAAIAWASCAMIAGGARGSSPCRLMSMASSGQPRACATSLTLSEPDGWRAAVICVWKPAAAAACAMRTSSVATTTSAAPEAAAPLRCAHHHWAPADAQQGLARQPGGGVSGWDDHPEGGQGRMPRSRNAARRRCSPVASRSATTFNRQQWLRGVVSRCSFTASLSVQTTAKPSAKSTSRPSNA